MNRELAEVRRYWPRARVLRGGHVGTHTRSGSGARVRLHYCTIVKQFVFQFYRLHTKRHYWVPVRVLNCGDDFPEAMRAAGFGVRPLGEFARKATKRQEQRQRIIESGRCGPTWAAASARLLAYYQPQLADSQRPRKGVRLGKRKRSGADKEDARQFAQWRARWTSCQ